nr:gliding motility-associated C-terminal domain-containing protein [uncultured Arsenicibacter sp.]
MQQNYTLRIFKVLIICLLGLFAPRQLLATHIVGGEFELRYLGATSPYSHRINMNMYFDDINGNAQANDPTVTIFIFRKRDNTFMASVTMPRVSQELISYTNQSCAVGDLRTRLIQYSVDVTFPSDFNDTGGYYMVWERCCRNNIISNITDPGGAGSVFYLEFPAPYVGRAAFANTSPIFGKAIGDYICINRPFTFSFAATDPDGDSLTYKIVTPYNGYSDRNQPNPSQAVPPRADAGPYPNVTWVNGISDRNSIPGSLPLQINPRTGLLTVVAGTTGLYVFSVEVDEYRRIPGQAPVRIGRVRRDFQLKVLDCPINNPPKIAMKLEGQKEFYKEGTVITIQEKDQNCFDLFVTDPDLNQRVTIVNASGTLPGLSLSATDMIIRSKSDTLKSRFCFGKCVGNGGVVTLAIRAVDESCPQGLSDTLYVQVRIVPEPVNRPDIVTNLTNNKASITVGSSLSFNAIGTDTDGDVISVQAIGRGFTLSQANMSFTTTSGTGKVSPRFVWNPLCAQATRPEYIVDFIVTKQRCNRTYSDTVTVNLAAIGKPSQQPVITTSLSQSIVTMVVSPTDTTSIRFTVLANDPERDSLTMKMQGQGFDPRALGAKFADKNGVPMLTSGFSWRPTCDMLNGKDEAIYTINFVADDRSCQPDHTATTAVQVRLVNPAATAVDVSIPNVITPNGDGKNDVWRISTLPVDNCSEQFRFVQILNRWGKEVFRSTSRDFQWDGDNLPVGTYFYLIQYTTKQYKGPLTIIR